MMLSVAERGMGNWKNFSIEKILLFSVPEDPVQEKCLGTSEKGRALRPSVARHRATF
jgi:hypothetical protein